MGNPKFRNMSPGKVRELFTMQFRDDPKLREVYKKYVENNQGQLRTMDEAYRAISKGSRIPSRFN